MKMNINKSKIALLLMTLLASLNTFAQNSMVGDGFGGRSGYSPTNYAAAGDAKYAVCATDKQLYAWGYNGYNLLGYVVYIGSPTPLPTYGMNSVRYIAGGSSFAVAIKENGSAWFWGTVNGSTFSGGAAPYVLLDADAYHAAPSNNRVAFVKTDGTVWLAGINNYGQFGNGATSTASTCTITTLSGGPSCSVQMPSITTAKRVASTVYHSIILLADGTVQQSGGYNAGTSVMPASLNSLSPIPVPGLSSIVDIKANDANIYALNSVGQVYSWGYQSAGLGRGFTNGATPRSPGLITFPTGAASIKALSAAGASCFALADDGKLYAWGSNNTGQLGDGTTTDKTSPVQVATNVRDVITSYYSTYIVKTDGTLWATGTSGPGVESSIWMNLGNGQRLSFTQITPTGAPMNLCAPATFSGLSPNTAGYIAPDLTPTTANNTCPTSTTVNLGSLAISSSTPNGATLVWSTHKTPLTAGDTLTTAQLGSVSTSGKYYAIYYDAINGAYSPSDSVTVAITACPPTLSVSNAGEQTVGTGQTISGNAATELAPSGGTAPYIYSNGSGDAACVAPSGATALTGLTVNADGTYSYTAPTTAGTYYYCIKVCDSSTPTANCVIKTYTTTVVALTPIALNNTCPTATVNLMTAVSTSTLPSGATVTWHTGTPATTANKVADSTAISTSGTYYLAYYDSNFDCYSKASQAVNVTIASCGTSLTANNPAAQTATIGQAKTGNAATELTPTGGVSPYVYSDGSGDAACVAPSGATALTGLTVNADGTYSYTAPTTASTYYYCIKVCDSATPAASCQVKTYTLVVTATATPLTTSNPVAQTATTGAAKTGNAATELAPTGGISPYVYSNGLGDAACVAPSGATALPAGSNLTVNSSTGAYSYTAPATAGTYYFCIKVCDSATPTASCVVKTYTLTVTAAPTCTVTSIVPTFIKN